MSAMASQITSLTIVYSIVYPDAKYQRKHQSSASLAFVRGIHRGPVNSPHKGPVTRKMCPHSVESPSMVDPQWDIWYWGSKWNLHTVCWSAVGCEWGTTSVYFGITKVCFIPGRLPVFAVEPQYLLQDFLFLSKVSFEGHIQNLQKISCWFKIGMRFVGPILIKLWTSCIWGFP